MVSLTDLTDISEEHSAIFDDIRLHCFYQALHVLLNSFFQEHLSHLQLVSIIIIILTIIVIIIMMIILKKTLITKNIFYYYDKILKKSKNTLKCLVKVYEKLTNTRFVYVYFLNFKEG